MKDELQQLLERLKKLRKAVKAEPVPQVGKKGLRDEANELGMSWHREFGPKLRAFVSADICDRYDAGFTRLIKLSGPSNLRSSYLETLTGLTSPFQDELIIPARQGRFDAPAPSAFDSFFSSIENPEESEYLREAVNCAKAGYYRAAAVLGWSAAIDRVHRKIEAVGFATFNVTSAKMASQQAGRYKKFNQVQNVSSISEIRDVFDTVVLWVIEGMALIDSNQHTRLKSCFDMRCHGAHPGDATISPFNLLSFFSDLDQIIFSSAKFKV